MYGMTGRDPGQPYEPLAPKLKVGIKSNKDPQEVEVSACLPSSMPEYLVP